MAQAKLSVNRAQAAKIALFVQNTKSRFPILYDPKTGVNLKQTLFQPGDFGYVPGAEEVLIEVPEGKDYTNLAIAYGQGMFSIVEGTIPGAIVISNIYVEPKEGVEYLYVTNIEPLSINLVYGKTVAELLDGIQAGRGFTIVESETSPVVKNHIDEVAGPNDIVFFGYTLEVEIEGKGVLSYLIRTYLPKPYLELEPGQSTITNLEIYASEIGEPTLGIMEVAEGTTAGDVYLAITLADHVILAEGSAVMIYDSEGNPLQNSDVIQNGCVLKFTLEDGSVTGQEVIISISTVAE